VEYGVVTLRERIAMRTNPIRWIRRLRRARMKALLATNEQWVYETRHTPTVRELHYFGLSLDPEPGEDGESHSRRG
jgi:hypothetical protein